MSMHIAWLGGSYCNRKVLFTSLHPEIHPIHPIPYTYYSCQGATMAFILMTFKIRKEMICKLICVTSFICIEHNVMI